MEKNNYTFKELSIESQAKVMKDRASYWAKVLSVDEVPTDSNYYKAYLKCNEANTPWAFVDTIVEYCKEELIKELSNCEFNNDGEIITK